MSTTQMPASARPIAGGSQGRAALQVLVTEASAHLVEVSPEDADVAIQSALQRILDHFGLDRCVLLRRSSQTGVLDVRRQAQGAGLLPMPFTLEADLTLMRALDQAVRGCTPVAVDAGRHPAAASNRQCMCLAPWGVGSVLVLSSATAGQFRHFLCLASSRRRRALSVLQAGWMRLLCDAIVSTLRSQELESSRSRSLQFERLLTDLSSGFAGAGWSDVDLQIERSLAALQAFTDADQCGIFEVLEDRMRSRLTHLASRRVTVPVGAVVEHGKLVPWVWERVVRQQTPLAFSGLQDFPPEAAVDRQYLEKVATQSAVYLPYAAHGIVKHILVIVHQQDRQGLWTDHFIERLKVLGWVFVSALSRKSAMAEQIRSLEQLGASRRFAHATLDALNEYVCVVDADGLIVEANDAWLELGNVAGIPREGLHSGGKLLHALESTAAAHGTHLAGLAKGMRDMLAAGPSSMEMEWSRVSSAGTQWFKAAARRFVVDEQPYVAVALQDISALRRSELELDELRVRHWHAERVTRTGVLIASLSHEICQPLAAILSNAQAGLRFLRGETAPLWQEIREILVDIVADDKRAARVIDTLRVMMRRQDTEREPVDVADVVRDVVGLLHTELIKQRVELEQRCEPGCIVMADRAQLQQVVLNLMVNGLEAMEAVPEASRRLRVAVSGTREDGIRIEVSDTGVGLTHAQLQKAFEAFWTTKPRGTGLGLPICHSIISAHGGRIGVESREGVGTTLLVSLPSHRPEPPSTPIMVLPQAT